MSENTPEQITYRNPVKGAGWAQVYHAITLDDRISHGAYRLLMLYEMHAQQKDLCWPGRERLSQMLKCSERSITRYNNELEASGYITRQRRLGTSTMTYIEDYEQIPRLREIAQETLSKRDTSGTAHVTPVARLSGHQRHVKNEEGKNEQEKKKPASVDAIPPEHTEQDDILDFFDGVVPEVNQEPAQSTMEKRDVIDDIVQQAGRRGDPLWWLKPGTRCGDHDYLEPYQAFCDVIGRDPSTVGEHKTFGWEKQLAKMAVVSPGGNGNEPVIIQPGVMAQAIEAIRDDWNFEHKRWNTPYHSGFADLVELTAAQIEGGTLPAGKQAKTWSTSL